MKKIASGLRLFLLAGFIILVFVEAFFSREGAVAEGTAASLQGKYRSLQDKFNQNQFKRPLYIESHENGEALQGEVYVVLDYPFGALSKLLKDPSAWCDILSLHFNIKYCQADITKSSRIILAYVGRKFEQPLEQASPVCLTFHAENGVPDHFRVVLNAESGPFNTHNYRIMLESIPLERGQTFIRLSYSYETSMMAKLAMKIYLGTLGSGKVGFTVVGRDADGRPIYTENIRGVMERNAMRYYLAMEAYLDALSLPPAQQLEARLQNWFAATERYALQLHEMDRGEYLAMKHREYARQISSP